MTARRPSAIDLLKLLDRSNCRECNLPTCMAFAAAVVRGERQLRDCPRITPEGFAALQREFGDDVDEPQTSPAPGEEYGRELMEGLMARLAEGDLAETAARVGGTLREGRLAIHCLGRIFELDAAGKLYSQCHVNAWVHAPLLTYAVESAGAPAAGEWVVFGQLRHAKDWTRFFDHRCDGEMLRIANSDPEVFLDLIRIFGGKPVADPSAGRFAPGALEIRPLPRLPILISYWPPEDGFDAKLSLFFDRSAEQNLPAESIYRLVAGLVEMLRKILQRHGALTG